MTSIKLDNETPIILILIFAMCVSLELYFTWLFPQSIVNIICLLISVPYMIKFKTQPIPVWLVLLLIINFLYNFFHSSTFLILPFFNTISLICISIFVIISSDYFKFKLYKNFDRFMKFICCVSLFGWILFLLGVPLPHYYSETSEYYKHEVYYLFIAGAYNILELVPRFCGMFLEPGHVGSTCCLLLYINKFNFKNKSNYIYLFSIIFSLSLAAYCLLVIGYFLYLTMNGKKIFKYLIFLGIFIFAIYIFGVNYNNGDNIMNEKIISRLIIEDGELSGDNRTSMLFDSYYEDWLKNGNLLTGYGVKAYGVDGNSANILHGCAGYKRFFFVNGIIGIILVILLFLSIFFKYRSKIGLGFFALFILCNMIRDYPFRLMWLLLFILGCNILAKSDNKCKHMEKQNIGKV